MPIYNIFLPMSTMQLAIDMNGRPRMRGMSASSSISMTTKSAGNIRWLTFTKTSSITPYGLMMERSANWRVMCVGIISVSPSHWHIERGIKLILAPKSIRALPRATSPIEHGIVTTPRSLCLGGRMC